MALERSVATDPLAATGNRKTPQRVAPRRSSLTRMPVNFTSREMAPREGPTSRKYARERMTEVVEGDEVTEFESFSVAV